MNQYGLPDGEPGRLSATRAIRSRDAPGQRIPSLALTAHVLSGADAQSLACGMDAHLTKPCSASGCKQLLTQYLYTPHSAADAVSSGCLHSVTIAAHGVPRMLRSVKYLSAWMQAAGHAVVSSVTRRQ